MYKRCVFVPNSSVVACCQKKVIQKSNICKNAVFPPSTCNHKYFSFLEYEPLFLGWLSCNLFLWFGDILYVMPWDLQFYLAFFKIKKSFLLYIVYGFWNLQQFMNEESSFHFLSIFYSALLIFSSSLLKFIPYWITLRLE